MSYQRQLAGLLWRQRLVLFALRLALLLIGIGLRAWGWLASMFHVGQMIIC